MYAEIMVALSEGGVIKPWIPGLKSPKGGNRI